MADGHEGTALAVAPLAGQVVMPWDSMKPLSYEMAMMLTGAEHYDRLEKVGIFVKLCSGVIRDAVLRYREEIQAAQDRYRKGECIVPGCPTWQEAVPKLFGFSYSYMREVLRGGKKPKARLPKKEQAALPQGEEFPDDEPTVTAEVAECAQAPLADSPTPVAPSATDGLSGLMGHFKETFAQREGREERLKEFFLMVDDEAFIRDIIHAATGACAVAASLGQKIEEARVPEAEGGGDEGEVRLNEEECPRSQELPSLIRGSLEAGKRDDPDHAAGFGVASDYAEDDAVDYGAFKPAVAVGDGNGNGCGHQPEDVPGCKALFLEQEAHGTDSLEVTETADPGSLPCAMPGKRKRAKHPPVPIVLEDGRCGHVVAGMGERTKRTVYGVALEEGGRAEVRKRLYATPANLGGMSLVPKAWLVDGEVSLDQVPAFLRGQAPAQESGSVEY